jgi:hypothetical protein
MAIRDYQIKKIEAVIFEAERFLDKADACKKRLEDDSWAIYGSKESGAMKRASMDLTRALAELRKP